MGRFPVTRAAAALAALVATVAAGVSFSDASFTAAKSNPSNTVATARIIPGDRVQSAWSLSDQVSGTAVDASDPFAFADGRLDTTSNTATTFASNRYLDLDFDSVVPSGLAPQGVTFNFDFADDNGDGKTTCFYFEVRRASTNAVLGTFGSTGSPVACESSVTMQQTSTSIASAVTSAGVANDLRVRVFATDEGGNTWRIDRATVSFTAYGKAWTEYPFESIDALDTSPATTTWGPANADGSSYQSGSNWPTSFSATKYIELTFPSNVPTASTLTSATLEHKYSSSSAGSNACYYVEIWSGGSLLASHGSTSSPVSCNSTTTGATDSISLPEVSTPAIANGLVVRIYAKSSGGTKTNEDRIALHLDYTLGSTGCSDPGTVTISATRDSWVDQNAPTSTSGGTGTVMKVKTQNGSRNRRGFVYYPLPSLGDGCSVTAATLRLYQTSTAGTRTIEALRASSSWTESALNWNNQPSATGTPVGTVANSAGAWVTWNVSTLAGQLYSSGNYGFVLRDSAEDAATAAEQQFQAREAAGNTAELVLTQG
jgi:hypothetical protein